jgi:hypothetical protein
LLHRLREWRWPDVPRQVELRISVGEHTMSLWLLVPLGIGILAVLIAVIKRRASNVTSLRIDH